MMRLPTPLPLREPETDHVWVIVPFSRPENAQRVVDNFARQIFPGKRLLVVLNGSAKDSVQASSIFLQAAAVLLTSDAHVGIAKNTALDEVRRRGGGFTAVMDDDDWYGPHYLTEMVGYARTYDLVGKGRHFIAADGELWLCGRERRARAGDDWITGGTICCWAESAPRYSEWLRWGEDAALCKSASSSGMRLGTTDLYHYLYCRSSTGKHTWPTSLEVLRASESAAGAIDLGPINYDVVSGHVLDVPARRLRGAADVA